MNTFTLRHRRAFTLVEMTTAFMLLAVLSGMTVSVYTGMARVRARGATQRTLVHAA